MLSLLLRFAASDAAHAVELLTPESNSRSAFVCGRDKGCDDGKMMRGSVEVGDSCNAIKRESVNQMLLLTSPGSRATP